jgi:hypothetical protein
MSLLQSIWYFIFPPALWRANQAHMRREALKGTIFEDHNPIWELK